MTGSAFGSYTNVSSNEGHRKAHSSVVQPNADRPVAIHAESLVAFATTHVVIAPPYAVPHVARPPVESSQKVPVQGGGVSASTHDVGAGVAGTGVGAGVAGTGVGASVGAGVGAGVGAT